MCVCVVCVCISEVDYELAANKTTFMRQQLQTIHYVCIPMHAHSRIQYTEDLSVCKVPKETSNADCVINIEEGDKYHTKLPTFGTARRRQHSTPRVFDSDIPQHALSAEANQ